MTKTETLRARLNRAASAYELKRTAWIEGSEAVMPETLAKLRARYERAAHALATHLAKGAK